MREIEEATPGSDSGLSVEERSVVHLLYKVKPGERVILKRHELWECVFCRGIILQDKRVFEVTLRRFDSVSANSIRNR